MAQMCARTLSTDRPLAKSVAGAQAEPSTTRFKYRGSSSAHPAPRDGAEILQRVARQAGVVQRSEHPRGRREFVSAAPRQRELFSAINRRADETRTPGPSGDASKAAAPWLDRRTNCPTHRFLAVRAQRTREFFSTARP